MTSNDTINSVFLAQAKVWLTRPAGQVSGLSQSLIAYGAEVLHLPMLAVEALGGSGQWPEAAKARVLNLDQYQLAFFISTNAARIGLACIDDYWPQYPIDVKNFAVGPSTAEVLEDYGLQVCFPQPEMSSEALLALPQLESVSGCKALIFRGEGGREILAEGLVAKGVAVEYAELYRRTQPQYEQQALQQYLRAGSPNAVVISSAEALENFHSVFQPCWPELMQVPLYVSSQRIAALASALGFEQIFIMPGANDEAIMASLGNL